MSSIADDDYTVNSLMSALVGHDQPPSQDALGRLAKGKLLTVAREGITAIPVYTVLCPWRRR